MKYIGVTLILPCCHMVMMLLLTGTCICTCLYSMCMVHLVVCLPCVHLPARNDLVNEVEFLGLIPQNCGRPMRLRDC